MKKRRVILTKSELKQIKTKLRKDVLLQEIFYGARANDRALDETEIALVQDILFLDYGIDITNPEILERFFN